MARCHRVLPLLLSALCAVVSGASHPVSKKTVTPIIGSMLPRLRGDSQATQVPGSKRSLQQGNECVLQPGFIYQQGMDTHDSIAARTECVYYDYLTSSDSYAALCLADPSCAGYAVFFDLSSFCLLSNITFPLIEFDDYEDTGPCDGIYIKADASTPSFPPRPPPAPAAVCDEPSGFKPHLGLDGSEWSIITCEDLGNNGTITSADIAAACQTEPLCVAFIIDFNFTAYCLYKGFTFPLIAYNDSSMYGDCDGIYIKSAINCTEPDGFSLHNNMDAHDWNHIIITCEEDTNITALYASALCLAEPVCAAYALYNNQTAYCLYSNVTYPLVDESNASMFGICDGIYIKSDSASEDSSTEESSSEESSSEDSSIEESSVEESSSEESSGEDSSTEEVPNQVLRRHAI